MSHGKQQPRFGPGEKVRVRHGVIDPDFPDIPIGGWAGKVQETEGQPASYLVR